MCLHIAVYLVIRFVQALRGTDFVFLRLASQRSAPARLILVTKGIAKHVSARNILNGTPKT